MVFAAEEHYPSLPDKAAALGFSLIQNHPFLDGDKRAAHAAMETLLILNGHEIKATVDDQQAVLLQVAAGEMKREAFLVWLREHIMPLPYICPSYCSLA